MKRLVCLRLGGTVLHEHPYLGHTDDWRNRVELLPGVVEGIKLLNRLPGTHLSLLVSAPGVAVQSMPQLTEHRVRELCRYVIDVLGAHHALVDDYFLCPHMTPAERAQHPELAVDDSFVTECTCFTPRLELVLKKSWDSLFVVSGRATDLAAGIAAGGLSVMAPPGKLTSLPREKVRVAQHLLAAAQLITTHARGDKQKR